jgi:hypothetical protein
MNPRAHTILMIFFCLLPFVAAAGVVLKMLGIGE